MLVWRGGGSDFFCCQRILHSHEFSTTRKEVGWFFHTTVFSHLSRLFSGFGFFRFAYSSIRPVGLPRRRNFGATVHPLVSGSQFQSPDQRGIQRLVLEPGRGSPIVFAVSGPAGFDRQTGLASSHDCAGGMRIVHPRRRWSGANGWRGRHCGWPHFLYFGQLAVGLLVQLGARRFYRRCVFEQSAVAFCKSFAGWMVCAGDCYLLCKAAVSISVFVVRRRGGHNDQQAFEPNRTEI